VRHDVHRAHPGAPARSDSRARESPAWIEVSMKARILLVDDDPEHCDALSAMLVDGARA
jgi:hypothetical protein